MSALAERTRKSLSRGYWAIQIREKDHGQAHRRYLCHAENDGAAVAIASRLMGSGMDVRGFTYLRIEPADLVGAHLNLPLSGAHQPVGDPQVWATLLAAHAKSEGSPPTGGGL